MSKDTIITLGITRTFRALTRKNVASFASSHFDLKAAHIERRQFCLAARAGVGQ